jgi:hypothetical protein
MRAAISESWVVYLMPVRHCPDGMRAVCAQSEWEAMNLASPGRNTLIQGGFTSEGEAERLARGASGATRPRHSTLRVTSWPAEAAAILQRAKHPTVG